MKNLDQLELFEHGITYRATCLRLVDEGRMPTLEAVRKAIQEALMESKKIIATKLDPNPRFTHVNPNPYVMFDQKTAQACWRLRQPRGFDAQ